MYELLIAAAAAVAGAVAKHYWPQQGQPQPKPADPSPLPVIIPPSSPAQPRPAGPASDLVHWLVDAAERKLAGHGMTNQEQAALDAFLSPLLARLSGAVSVPPVPSPKP